MYCCSMAPTALSEALDIKQIGTLVWDEQVKWHLYGIGVPNSNWLEWVFHSIVTLCWFYIWLIVVCSEVEGYKHSLEGHHDRHLLIYILFIVGC